MFADDGGQAFSKTAGRRVAHPSSRVYLKQMRVPLDKSEGSVKGIVFLGGASAPLALPERLRTKTLEISR
jgi:hypothetical protein